VSDRKVAGSLHVARVRDFDAGAGGGGSDACHPASASGGAPKPYCCGCRVGEATTITNGTLHMMSILKLKIAAIWTIVAVSVIAALTTE
jgi:hypothetical protein